MAVKSWFILAILFSMMPVGAQTLSPAYSDLSHDSKVFGHQKSFRLYLPKGYEESSQRYPVIYFFHGWGGRYFKDDNALLEYDMIGDLVNKYKVILVMWDGNIEENEPRPYNIGNHKDIKYKVQMKDYFPELVSYIDSTYRTLTDRSHRGIIGFSMGGIMSFFLAGKYPDRVCAAINLAGTPEFFIGYPENHTLYQVRYTFKNLMDVNTRQQGGDSDILVYLNEEVQKGAAWEGNPYEFWGFHGGHMVDRAGETMAFEKAMKFVVESFNKNLPKPEKWSHYDIYDSFNVWDYQVTSNKNVPGFIYLRNVNQQGFGFSTHRWLPDGPSISNIRATVTTASQYIPNKKYHIISCSPSGNDSITDFITRSGNDGRITVEHDGGDREYGIYAEDDAPEYVALGYRLNHNNRYLTTGKENSIVIKLFNRGGENASAQKVFVHIQTSDSSVSILQDTVSVVFEAGRRIQDLPAINLDCHKMPTLHGEPFQIKFNVIIRVDEKEFSDELIVPVLFNGPQFTGVILDDGQKIKDNAYGSGNGNGQAESGEKVLVYSGNHRLRLYTNDPYVIGEKERLVDEQLPSIWEDSFALSSVVSIAADCPDGHVIEFTGNYESNTYNPIERNVHWGTLSILVKKPK